jgi:hypothetical protein
MGLVLGGCRSPPGSRMPWPPWRVMTTDGRTGSRTLGHPVSGCLAIGWRLWVVGLVRLWVVGLLTAGAGRSLSNRGGGWGAAFPGGRVGVAAGAPRFFEASCTANDASTPPLPKPGSGAAAVVPISAAARAAALAAADGLQSAAARAAALQVWRQRRGALLDITGMPGGWGHWAQCVPARPAC